MNAVINLFVTLVSLFVMFLGFKMVHGGLLLDGSVVFICGVALLLVEG